MTPIEQDHVSRGRAEGALKLKTQGIRDTVHIIEIRVGTVPYRGAADGA
ncbi:hypothetical protein [Paraburkholderia eburnea]|nr:hypothetical protein [Paraburkholderia eburnea]